VGEYGADLTAEVLAQAWRSRMRFRDQHNGSALPWLYGIAQNVLQASVRKRRVERSAEPSWVADLDGLVQALGY
jgi:DNA-directed RNA polymerase specialized sigma24 family protein